MTLRVFGEPWDSAAVRGALPAPTPAARRCVHCAERVAQGDRGFLVPREADAPDGEAVVPSHRECLLWAVCGNASRPSGAGGRRRGPTVRQRALRAWDALHGHGASDTVSPGRGTPADPAVSALPGRSDAPTTPSRP